MTYNPWLVAKGHPNTSQGELLILHFEVSNISRTSLVRYSLYKLHKIGDNQLLLPIFTLLASPGPSLLHHSNPSMCNFSEHSFFRDIRHKFHLGSALIWPRVFGQMLSASLRSKHIIHHLCPKFVLTLFSTSK